jgi:membrane-associated phospholipid phosphatase
VKPSRVISVLFHPVIMPLAGVIILLTHGGWLNLIPAEGKRFIYLIVGITTLALPLIMMPILLRMKVISNYLLQEKEERRIPLLIMAMLYLIGAYALQKIDGPILVALFLNGSSMVLLTIAIFNWKWKVSTHMAGIGGVTGMVLAISMRWMLNEQVIIGVLFLIAGLVGYARLKEDDHTPGQVYVGYLIGFFINFMLIRFI